MANIYSASRDYTKPAIDQRVAELLKRRIGAREDLPTESTKERLAKFKEIRNARQGLLKITHRHVLETVAYILNIGTEVLEEGILDKDEYVNVFNSFFTEGGRQAIVVYLQPMSPPTFDSGRWTPQLSKEQQVIRCCITDGTTEEFSGRCVIVYRLKSNMEFGIKQLLDETYYAYAEVDPTSRCVLAGISDLISRLHVRTLTANTQWGELSKSEIGEKMKDNFIGNFKDFCEFLSMTKIDLENVVCFQVNWDLYQKCLAQPENIRKNIRKLDVIAAAEADVRMWMKLMERAIVESQQLRRETETVGPTAELTYWRRLLGQFSSIMNHIKSSYAQAFIQLLTEAKSKLVKKWKILEDHVTTVHILSQDNVKYLYALEKFTQPLYRLDPTKIGDYLPALMYAIRMMYATSRFFNTRKMVTAVYVKITNQMILACKVYLTEDGKISVWNESKCTMISKIKNCIKLCEIYHNCYDDMCKKVEESSDENPFEVSEMYVFGKFATFKTRIIKIMDILETTRMYSILHSSTIEGISTYAQKYMDHFEKISSQNYDPLDHRKPYFDTDYDEFKKSVAEIDVELRTFFHNCVSLMPNVTQSLNLIARFQKLNLKQLRIDRKCMELISMFEQEIEDIRDIYNENRSDPPIPRNIPPIAGRILWVRQLYKRIEVPMNMFKSYHRVITFDSMQKCIKIYNILVNVFIHYELIYYKAWYDSTNIVCLALSSPLFVRHPKTNKYCLNFDSYIYEVIRESEYMSKFGLEVPDFIQILIFCKEKIFLSYERVKKLLKKNDALRKSIPILFLNLMKPALVNLEIAFQPCVSVVTWSSLKISNACAKLEEEIKNAQIIVKEVVDMKEARVDEVLESIAEMILLKLDDYPKSPEQLLADNTDFRDKIAIDLEIKSSVAEKAVIMIINKFIDLISDPTVQNIKYNWMDPERIHRQIGSESRLIQGPFEPGFGYIERTSKVKISQVHNDCIELFAYYNNKLTEALVKCTKNSLDLLKKKATVMSVLVEDIAIDQEIPIMMTYFVLQIPNIIISPSIEELQSHFSKVITNIIETHKKVFMWGQRYSTNAKAKPLENLPNTYFQSVFDHKDIIRSSMSLQGLILILRDDVSKVGNSYLRYSYIWAENRNEIIQSFIDSKPLLQEIKEKFLEYEDLMTEIKNLPDRHILGPLQINTDKLKLAFLVEANAWKKSLGILLSNKYKEKLRKITDYIFDKNKVLARHIKDLEDVRVAMKCLGEIRDNFVSIDMELILIEETYTLMGKFNVDILKEDQDIVDGLRYNFSNLLNTAKQVQAVICEMQEPLKKELVEGVAVLKKKVAQFDIDFELNGPMVEGIPAKEASERLILFQARFEELWERYETYSSGESLFGIEVTEYPALQQRKRETNLLQKLYTLYLQVMHTIDSYYDIPWSEIDIESIITELADFQNKCRKLPKAMREWPAYIDLKKKIDDFNEMCPLLEMMANKAMKNRHWEKLSKLCKYFFDVESETFTLANVMQAPLLKYKDDVEDICISAVKEQDIEFKLKQIIADWAVINLQFALFKQRGELLLKGIETAEIIAQLEDSLMIISSLLANRYNAPFKKEIQLWQTKLSNTSEILAKWLTVQNLWAYLEAVFIGGDISKQLPTEAKRFNTIDKAWIKLMLRAHEKLNAVETCTGDETMSQFLPHILEQLEWCQKSLSGYLETKRVIFPRFCFISDPTLLEILGQAADCHTIQNYLDGFFDNVSKLKFSEKEYDKIVAMYSREDEQIVLEKEVACTGGVENWLNVLLTIHQQSVGAVISLGLQSLRTSEFDILLLIENSILQVGLLALQVLWTHDSEIAITTAKRDRTIMKKTNRWFLDLLNSLIEITVKDLTKYARIKYECLITIHVHQRDIFDELCRLRIRSIHDFEWLKQCRFYYNDDSEEVPVKITDIEFVYQNEFLGCTDRLAITPLTDRCYITLAQAVGMNFGGAPTGPAGTGKTETTKDMGKALGKYVVVFNCSDQMDFRGLGRIFKGLAQSGTWGCFDEFNRIDLSVLSVAAQQIAIIFNTRKERKTTFLFSDGETYKLNYEFGIFITMNPGYAGRQELPENLKIQFRSVAMMVPDRQIIMRVKLAACGFKENVLLARKFFILYKLCEEQLSKQVHYDFGLRNILSCLRTLSAQKRANPIDSEETTLMRVLCNMNLSKLVDEDEPLFMSLIEDMFPGIKLTTQTYKELQKAIENATDALNIINHKEWNLKTVQLYETSLVRHGLMVLGPTGSGKTRCMWALMRALTEMGMPHKEIRMNPKAITASQMFGRLDVATNDWTDGIFSIIWRRSTQTKKTENLWMVLDGPVDAVWIENLNSVLDDNKTLTLANGDRIIMAPNTKLVFEPDNVDNASPATISRMGMVFVSASVLKWNSILEGWLRKCSSNEARVLRTLFDQIYGDAHTFVQTKLQAKMMILEALYIRQCIDLLEGLNVGNSDPTKTLLAEYHIEKLFLFSLMWSLGAMLELDGRLALQEYLINHESHCNWPKCIEDETIFEYLVSDDGKWMHWSKMVPKFEYPSDRVLEYHTILVPNVDNTRTLYLIDIIARQEKAVLLIGEAGTAKSMMMKSYMFKHDPEYHLNKFFNFSSASTPNMVQRVFESYVEKRVGTTYGPPGGRKMTIFIDDINMPTINEWGDQITNELIRQLMEYKGFYSLDKPGDFCTMQDIMLLAAMHHSGGGRNDIPERLKRQFNIFNCTLPSNKSMDTIFSVIGQGYFCLTRFSETIVNFLPKLISLTRLLWQNTKAKMLPTPAKFHYVFNLRDLSRIWEGMLRIQRAECESITTLLKLWKHECTRVIADRFITAADKEWFQNTLWRIAEKILGPDFQYYSQVETYFVDFLREPPEPTGDEPEDFILEAPKVYEEIPSYDVVIAKVQQNMEQFNEYIRGMHLDLVFFHDALVHLIRISRILGVPRGNALLVGIGGSGKQSLTRLASFIAGYNFFQITLSRIYNVASLMDDLRKLYRSAGIDSKGLTFIFTDNEVKDEAFLEYINNILSVGEVANLFPKDELDEILTTVTPFMKKTDPRRPLTQDNLYDYFISKARNNLHIVLCFSPISGKFRSRALKFPGLISSCTINWFSSWPKDALYAVGEHFLGTYKVICSPEVKQQLMHVVGDIQDDVSDTCTAYFDRFRRQIYVTPRSFLTFLDSYKTLYKQRLDNINTLTSRMSSGLNKLIDAAAQVDVLRHELEKTQEEIAAKNIQVEAILVTVNEKKREAEDVKAKVQVSKDEAEKILKVIAKDKAVAEQKLEAAEPALLEAEAALQTIKAVDIATVRKLAKPPYLITLIMDCVLILFGRKLESVKLDYEHQFLQPSWSESLKVLADTRFLYNLQNFPKDNINAETVDLMMPYLNFHMYTYEAAKQACGNVAGLIQWTISMIAFYEINKDVLPLKANLFVQENKYEIANKNLLEAEELLKEKDDALKIVQNEFDAVMRERQKIIDQAAACQAKMDIAFAMIEGLSGEKIRWTDQVTTFKSETERLVGDVLVLTGFLCYCGPFNQEFRVLLQKKWFDFIQDRKIPISVTLNIVNVLTDTAMIGDWNLQGLPTDELSVQNGIIVTKALRYPLLIDPQLQGKTWIKNKEKGFDLQVTWFSHKYFKNHLEDSVSIGRPLLIQDVGEEIDPVLDNLLEKNFIKIGTSFKVKLGDKEVDISKDFRLYITTKLPNPFYTPEIFAHTSIIDFTVTMKGLEDQLLGRVILSEREELETEKKQLIADVTANNRKIKELETNLLHKLGTVQGSLIEDVELMSVLNTTKQTAAEINRKLNIAKETELKIDVAREEFRPVATRGSVLYFLICDMPHVNSMYQTSLVQFLERFDISMARSEKSPVNQKRIYHIIEYLTYDIFKHKARGLYEIHKYMFILLMTLKIDLQRGSITYEEFQYLIKGGAALDLKAVEPKPCKWITDVTWLNLVALSSLRQFQYIVSQVSASEKVWKHWFDKDAPEEEVIPDGYHALDSFRRLLLIRAWCMDRALSQSRKYIASSLGAKYAEPVITRLDVMHNESRPNTPMICFLSLGSDPTPSIEQLAKRMEIVCRSISMGQGQEVHARRLLSSAKTEGFWTLCQNCHLSLEYMAELANFLLEMEAPHPDFRVWITTEPHKDFPVSLLQMSIKYTYEPPQGIRAGLLATYSSMNQEMLDQCDAAQYIPLIYSVSFLHTVVQERRKFGSLGWNVPYEFNLADWLASCMFINNHLNDYNPKRGINWQSVRYMIGEVQYGGRVTDDYDKRLLNTFAKVWFTEALFAEERFVFYKNYPLLIYKQVNHYMKAIDGMSPIDPPQVYGLHPNADITYQSNTTQTVLDLILSVQPKEAGVAGAESREAVVARQAKEMLEKVPTLYDMFEVKERLHAMDHTAPMNIFLKQEINRIQMVIKLIRVMLKDLLLAIEGIIIMSEELRDIFDNIYDAKIPKTWKARSWESASLGFWFTELLERNQQFSTWLYSGRPIKFWMTGFFNPQGFLTAMKQEITRAHKWALDNVTVHNEVLRNIAEEIKKPPSEGVYVYGLFLEGAGWDRRNSRLCESANKVLYVLMPVVHIFVLHNADKVPLPQDKNLKLYQCPVYKKPQRGYMFLITSLLLPTLKSPDHWILRGVALLCDNK
ncbi:dynein heavy chain 8, axonemal [Monomorium pharaonis]|uniref:dynein heavy chain 8, axonemal n=1 Tax=Monomorium pharaonis TaxID=307658 RepID=UPI001746DBC1|nr:dynein heavy chain 8, axonemal [Monomorium pharaonis]